MPTSSNGRASELTTLAKPQGNAHGAWVHCTVCNLRLQYVPKKGSSSGSTKVENLAMIQRMLQRLQRLQPMTNDEWVQAQLTDLLGDGQADRGRGSVGNHQAVDA